MLAVRQTVLLHQLTRLYGRLANALQCKSTGQGFDSWTWQGERAFFSASESTPLVYTRFPVLPNQHYSCTHVSQCFRINTIGVHSFPSASESTLLVYTRFPVLPNQHYWCTLVSQCFRINTTRVHTFPSASESTLLVYTRFPVLPNQHYSCTFISACLAFVRITYIKIVAHAKDPMSTFG